MKPNASLKSLNVNFLLMASRPFTSLQPLSLARALWRAAPVNFSAMVRTSWSPRLCHESPCAGHSQRRPERLPNREQSRRLVCAEGPHVVVAEYRHHRRNGGAPPPQPSVVFWLEFSRPLAHRPRRRSLAPTGLSAFSVRRL